MTNALRLPHLAPATHSTASLRLTAVPSRARRRVEDALVECLPAPSQITDYATDPLYAEWFTQWQRTPGKRGMVDCAQLLTGSPEELGKLRLRLEELSGEWGFDVDMVIVD